MVCSLLNSGITMRRLHVLIGVASFACFVLLIRSPVDKTHSNNCDFSQDTETMDWLRGFFGNRTSAYCRQEFPQVDGPTLQPAQPGELLFHIYVLLTFTCDLLCLHRSGQISLIASWTTL